MEATVTDAHCPRVQNVWTDKLLESTDVNKSEKGELSSTDQHQQEGKDPPVVVAQVSRWSGFW